MNFLIALHIMKAYCLKLMHFMDLPIHSIGGWKGVFGGRGVYQTTHLLGYILKNYILYPDRFNLHCGSRVAISFLNNMKHVGERAAHAH